MKRTVNVWLFVACMVVMVIAFGVVNAGIVSNTEALQQEYHSVNKTLTDLKNEKQELQEELDTVGTDAFVERQARDQYDYMMPDELRFVISFPEEAEEPSVILHQRGFFCLFIQFHCKNEPLWWLNNIQMG